MWKLVVHKVMVLAAEVQSFENTAGTQVWLHLLWLYIQSKQSMCSNTEEKVTCVQISKIINRVKSISLIPYHSFSREFLIHSSVDSALRRKIT